MEYKCIPSGLSSMPLGYQGSTISSPKGGLFPDVEHGAKYILMQAFLEAPHSSLRCMNMEKPIFHNL